MEDPDPDPNPLRSFLVPPAPTPNQLRSASSSAPPHRQSPDPQLPSPDLPTDGSLPGALAGAAEIEAAKGPVHRGLESPAHVPQSPPAQRPPSAQALPQPASPTPNPHPPVPDPPPHGQTQAHPLQFEEPELPIRNATSTPPASGDGPCAPEPPKSTTNPPNQNLPPMDPASPSSELPIQGSLTSGSSSAAHPGNIMVSRDEVSLALTGDLFGSHSPIGRPILPSIVLDLQQFFVPNSNNQPHPCKQSALPFLDPQLEDLQHAANGSDEDLGKIQVHDETLQRRHTREEKGKGKFEAEQHSDVDSRKSGHASGGQRWHPAHPDGEIQTCVAQISHEPARSSPAAKHSRAAPTRTPPAGIHVPKGLCCSSHPMEGGHGRGDWKDAKSHY